MINIIEIFFELYENKRIEVNWNKENLSFNFVEGPKILTRILKKLNEAAEENDEVEESDIVGAFFAIISNRISEYYNEEVSDKDLDEEITSYIKERVSDETLNRINTDIFLDNNIYNNRFSDISYEVLTKRDNENISDIRGYTLKVIFEALNSQREEKEFEFELKLEDLEEIISKLNNAKENLEKLNEKKEE